jgi:hypothetical protein
MMLWRRHAVSEEELTAYVDGQLDAVGAARLEAHSATCEECATAIAELRALKSVLSALPAVSPSRSFVLTLAMAGDPGQSRPRAAGSSSRFAFAPALAMAVLVLLFAIDFTVIGGGRDESGGTFLASDSRSAADGESAKGAPAAEQPDMAPAARGATPAADMDSAAQEPEQVRAAADEAAPPPDAAAPTLSQDGSTARDILRVLQIVAALALLVSLFVWLRARLGLS